MGIIALLYGWWQQVGKIYVISVQMFLQNDLVADLQTLFLNVYLLCLSFFFLFRYLSLTFSLVFSGIWQVNKNSWVDIPLTPLCFSFVELNWFVFLCASIYGFLFSSCLPETLAMKGLTLNCMDRKSEAYELVRQGLKVVMLAPPVFFVAINHHSFFDFIFL